MKPKVTLVSWTKDPIRTIYILWEASRTTRPYGEIYDDVMNNPQDFHKIVEVFKKVIDSNIPVSENIQFNFLLENISISFREQMVRHRIGVKVGEQFGADIIPGLEQSTWWSQSIRILNMGQFADEGRYRMPDFHGHEENKKTYTDFMKVAQDTYQKLLGSGQEDAREVLPMATQHRVSWAVNLSALQHIVGKRGCWILQHDLWEPIIHGMIDELVNKIHPYFRTLINPPCIKGDQFIGCLFKLDNERRISGEDKIPPCSLYLTKHTSTYSDEAVPKNVQPEFYRMIDKYRTLWGRNPWTGDRIEQNT